MRDRERNRRCRRLKEEGRKGKTAKSWRGWERETVERVIKDRPRVGGGCGGNRRVKIRGWMMWRRKTEKIRMRDLEPYY